MNKTLKVLTAAALLCIGQFATAAHITIDDTDVDNVTISWANFEGGFNVNGTAYGAGGSVTVADLGAPLTFGGQWIDLNAVVGATSLDFGANAATPTEITSILTFDVTNVPSYANIDGAFQAYNASSYLSGPPSSYFQGDVLNYGAAFLTFLYKSEAGESTSVPAPPMLALFGLALLGLGARRKRQH